MSDLDPDQRRLAHVADVTAQALGSDHVATLYARIAAGLALPEPIEVVLPTETPEA